MACTQATASTKRHWPPPRPTPRPNQPDLGHRNGQPRRRICDTLGQEEPALSDLAAPELGQTNQNSTRHLGLAQRKPQQVLDLNLSLNAAHNNSTCMAAPIRPPSTSTSPTACPPMPQPVSGPLLHVLGHAAIYDVNLAYQRSSFHQSAGSALRQQQPAKPQHLGRPDPAPP
jgi:hypothetical protein